MNVKTPTLRKHKDGRYLTKWGGRNHYFGRNRADAVARYTESLTDWSAWRESQQRVFAIQPHRRILVEHVADLFLKTKMREGGLDRRCYYEKHLRRFLTMYGRAAAVEIRVGHVQGIKDDMLDRKYSPKTANHDVTAIKGMFQWAQDQELIPLVNLRGCKQIPLPPPHKKAMSTITTSTMIATAPYDVMCWLAVNYLTACRPIEVVRLVHKQGEWTEPGVFRLASSKVATRTQMPRHILVSDQAKKWLERCEPRWSRLDSYSAAVRKGCAIGGPHPLRHSAATHLHQQGVARADIDLILGHMPKRVSLIYVQIAWQPLLRTVARLTL